MSSFSSAVLVSLVAGAAAQSCDITDSLPDLLFISSKVVMGDIDAAAPFTDGCGAATNPGSDDLTAAIELNAADPFVMVSSTPDEVENQCFRPGFDWGGNCGDCGAFAPMIAMVGSDASWPAPSWFTGPITVSARPAATRRRRLPVCR